MSPLTRPYRNQHAALRRLAATIPAQAPVANPRLVRCSIVSIRSMLAVHLKIQNGMLYPWMMRHAFAEVRERARHYRQETAGLLIAVEELERRWDSAQTIAGFPDEFLRTWTRFHDKLERRLAAEERDLYDVIDKCTADPNLALAC